MHAPPKISRSAKMMKRARSLITKNKTAIKRGVGVGASLTALAALDVATTKYAKQLTKKITEIEKLLESPSLTSDERKKLDAKRDGYIVHQQRANKVSKLLETPIRQAKKALDAHRAKKTDKGTFTPAPVNVNTGRKTKTKKGRVGQKLSLIDG